VLTPVDWSDAILDAMVSPGFDSARSAGRSDRGPAWRRDPFRVTSGWDRCAGAVGRWRAL